MPTPLPARPSLDWLRRRAKRLLKQLRTTRPRARLAEAQLALAREYGFPSWRKLKAHIEAIGRPAATRAGPPSEELVAGFLRRVGVGDRAAVEAMLREHPGLVNAVGPHPFWGGRLQPLHVAIETGRRDIFDLLLKAGADVNGDNAGYLHWSPLLLASNPRRAGIRRTLLRRGAHVGLAEALAMGDDRRALRLMRGGRRALSVPAPNEGTFLMFARSPKTIDRLLELKVPVDQRDRWGAGPMDWFSRLGRRGKPLVRHLLRRGVGAGPEVHARLNDRRTLARLIKADPAVARMPAVLHGAVNFRHHALVAWLLGLGADPNGRIGGEADQTPLHSAAWNGDLEMVKLLLDHGADRHARDRHYDSTPAGWAETAIEVTNNPQCREVVGVLAESGTPAP
jgi:ankyrin repeat protein